MKTILSTDNQFSIAKSQLSESRKLKSRADKLEKSAKTFVAAWLLENRQIDISQLSIGDTLIIKLNNKDCISLTVKSRNQVDLAVLSSKYPEIEKECRRDKAVVYYDVIGEVETLDIQETKEVLESKKEEILSLVNKLIKVNNEA